MKFMCYNCGCHIPEDDMGHPDNINTDKLKEIAGKLGDKGDGRKVVYDYLEAQSTDPNSAKNPIIEDYFTKAAKAWGQSLADAKKQAHNMLKGEL